MEVTRLRWPLNAARPMPTRSFEACRPNSPTSLAGEPIVRRTDLGPEGIYYRAPIGPFVSMKAAAGVCSSLKAAGESCLVEKN